MNIDTSLLQAFVAVQEANGFTRAAERLHLTQSAVSHQIRRLEEMVGRPLFHRTTRRLGLTADGEDFLRHARHILEAQAALSRHFRSSPIEGTVRFGVPESFMSEGLPHLLRQFSCSCPNVRLEVSVGTTLDLPTMLREQALDLAVLVSPAGQGPGTLLRRVPVVWAAAQDFTWPRDGSLPLAYSPPPCVCRELCIEALKNAGLPWHGVFTSHSLADLRAVALSGLAVTAFTHDHLRPGMVELGAAQGLPPLPSLDFTLVHGDAGAAAPAVAELGRLITQVGLEPAPTCARSSPAGSRVQSPSSPAAPRRIGGHP